MPTFAEKAILYFSDLNIPPKLPNSVKVLNPYEDNLVKEITKKFYKKFYNDENNRTFIIGINPGRFGGGITGISFTDPVALRNKCGIPNNLGIKKELSSQFIYWVIESFGGTKKFFSKYYLTALYSLAFLKDGKNFNYYDDKQLLKIIKPFLIESLKKQIDFGCYKGSVICLGKKNGEFLQEVNNELNYFKEIKILDHPRFIMQYRRKLLNNYIDEYLNVLHSGNSK